MHTDLTHNEEELLSETCRRLAARLADLIDRTMNLYERDLATAEATPPCRSGALAGQKTENQKCRADAPIGQTSENVENPPRNYATRTTRTSCLNSIKSLVHAMEGLLRCAKLARELEKADEEENFIGFTGEEIAQMLGEEYEGGSKKSNIDNPPSHPTFQTFSPRTQAPP